MTTRILSPAHDDLAEAVRYDLKAGGTALGNRFAAAYDAALDRVEADPAAFPVTTLVPARDPPRRCPLGRPWPYDLLYWDRPSEIVVVAVRHHSRDPAVLAKRL